MVPGEQLGVASGLRFGFGYDLAKTLRGLAAAGRELDRTGTRRKR